MRAALAARAANGAVRAGNELRRIACETAYLYLAKNELRDCAILAQLKRRRRRTSDRLKAGVCGAPNGRPRNSG